jgi:hypothetical protein
MPVLVFNRYGWYPSTDFFKWTLVFSVSAYGVGICSLLSLSGRGGVSVDSLDLAWLGLALLLSLQPLFIHPRSFPEWIRNWYFFSAIGGAAFFLSNLPIDEAMPAIMRSGAITGGISTAIGFVQRSDPNALIPFISDISMAPDRFFANTNLDNVLAGYLALAVIAGFWLLIRAFCGAGGAEKSVKAAALSALDLALIVVNVIGLWMTGTRSAFLACIAGVFTLICAARPNVRLAKKIAAGVILALLVLSCAVYIAPNVFQVQRRDMGKILTLESLSPLREGRFAIWGISMEMIKTAPILGVGLGNYKWNYLDAMASFMERSGIPPRYTHWAHSEYLQWMAETGAVGAILLFSLVLYYVRLCVKSLDGGSRVMLAWSLAAIAALAVDSLFSRPFHHADTAFTFSLALALISRLCVKKACAQRDERQAEPALSVRGSARTSRMDVLRRFPVRAAASAAIFAIAAGGVAFYAQSFSGQAYLGKYYYDSMYISLVPSEEREEYTPPLFLRDAYLRLTAKENYNRTFLGFGDREKNDEDAVRLLKKCFETEPRYEELNMLMSLYQKLGRTDEGRSYFKYYPPGEREKFLKGEFDGRYMLD